MDLRDLVEALRKRLKNILKLLVLFMLCAVLVGILIPPLYVAKTDLLINSSTGKEVIETYKQIMKSDRMGSLVIAKLDSPYTKSELAKKIKIESSDGSQIITIIAHEKTPEESANLANTYATIFQEEIRTLMNLDNVTILTDVTAEIDTKKNNPNLLFYLSISFVMSVFICIVTIIIKEVYFPILDSERKIERTLEIPLLGSIVSKRIGYRDFSNPNELSNSHYVDLFPRASEEDFSKLAANIHYLVKQKEVKTIMMTSTNTGDGKTFIGGNLAVALAMDNKKTLFVDADFQKSDGRRLFNLPERKGLTSFISGNSKLNEIIQKTGLENLYFISTGPIPPNPTPYLLSDDMDKVMHHLRAMFDVIIIDAPDLTVADAMILLPLIDGCIFIVNASKTSEKDAVQNIRLLKKVNGNIFGAVLNDIEKR